MSYPREMTIATGTTVYAGDPDSDERVISREVRVSVTYEIDDDETDVPLLAAVKAAEVEQAHLAVRRRVSPACPPCVPDEEERFDPSAPGLEPPDDAPEPPDELEPPDEIGPGPDPFPEEANYLRASVPNGGRPGDEGNTWNGKGTTAVPATYSAPAAYQAAEAETDWATKPQVLAIRSHFTRLGLSHENQTALLRARFGKFRPERLTKDEAASLMRYLERGEWEEQNGWEPAVAAPIAR